MFEYAILSMKYIIRQRQRTISFLMALALSSALVNIGFNISTLVNRAPIYSILHQRGLYHYYTGFYSHDEIDVVINELDIPSSFYSRMKHFGTTHLDNDLTVAIYGTDNQTLLYEFAQLIGGRFPEHQGEAVMEAHLLYSLGNLRIGEEFFLNITKDDGMIIRQSFNLTGVIETMPSRARHFGEYGITYTTNDTVALAYNGLTAPTMLLWRITQLDSARDAFNLGADEFSTVQGAFISEAMNEFHDNLEEKTGVSIRKNDSYYGVPVIETTTLSLYIVPIVLITSFILVYGIVYISLLERKKQFNMLLALGASNNNLRNMLTFEGSVLGLAGGVLGTSLGVVLYNFIIRGILSSGFNVTNPPGFYSLPIVYSVMISAGLSIISLHLAYHLGVSTTKAKKGFRLFRFSLEKPIPFLLCIFIQDRKNLIIMLSFIASMIAAVFSIFTYSRFSLITREGIQMDIHGYDFQVSLEMLGGERFLPEEKDRVSQISGVQNVYGVFYYNTTILLDFDNSIGEYSDVNSTKMLPAEQSGSRLIEIYGVLVVSDDKVFIDAYNNGIITAEELHTVLHGGGAIVFPNVFHHVYFLNPIVIPFEGDILFSVHDDFSAIPIVANVDDGIFSNLFSYSRLFSIYTSRMNDLFLQEETYYHSFHIKIDANADRLYISQHLSRLFSQYRTSIIVDSYEEARKLYDYSRNTVVGLLVVSFVIYAAMLLNVFNTIVASLSERKKEFVILRTLGMPHSALKKLLITEGVVVSAVSSTTGLLLGLSITLFIARNLISELSLLVVLGQSPWGLLLAMSSLNGILSLVAILLCVRGNKFSNRIP